MANIFNDDFAEFIRCFNKHEVQYILVGGMAVILHGYVRTTGDMDIWVNKTRENYQRIKAAFHDFGMPLFDMTPEKFLGDEFDVWGFGREPVKIELMTSIKGLGFDDAFANAQYYTEGETVIRFLHLNNLIEAKKAAGRHRDIDDIEQLDRNLQ